MPARFFVPDASSWTSKFARIMPEDNLWLDETLDTKRLAGYDLLLAPTESGLHLLLHEAQRRIIVGYAYEAVSLRDFDPWGESLARICARLPWLEGTFARVKLCYASTTCTVVPTHLLDPLAVKPLLEAVCGPIESAATIFQAPASPDSTLLFTAPGDMVQAYSSRFPGLQYQHPWASLAHHLTLSPKRRNTIAICLHQGYAALLATQGGRLLSLVPRPMQEARSVLYGIAALHELYQWSPRETTLHLFPMMEPPRRSNRGGKGRKHSGAAAGVAFPSCRDIELALAPYYPRPRALALPDLQSAYRLESLLHDFAPLISCLEY